MACGIYCIENKVNGKKYIGQSIDIDKRWKEHKKLLNGKKHTNKYLQYSWNKYGENAFYFSIVELCESDVLDEKEIYWIDYYNTFKNGYNLTVGGDGGNTIAKYSDDEYEKYRAKKRKIHKATALKGEDVPRSKLTKANVLEIIQKLLNGEYNADIAKEYKVNPSTIYDIRVHNTWNSLTDGIEFPHVSKVYEYNKIGKPVSQFTKEGEYIATYANMHEAERQTGCPYKNISAVCNGTKHTCLGYIWKFADSI